MSDALKQIWEKVDQMIGPQRMETEAEHIARDMREGRFPKRSDPIQVPVAGPAAARHLAPGDDLVERLLAPCQNEHTYDADKEEAAERISILTDRLAKDAKAHEKEVAVWSENYAAKEREAAARLSALTAQVAKTQADRDKWFEGAGAHHVASMKQAQRADQAEAEVSRLRDRLARVEGAWERVGIGGNHLATWLPEPCPPVETEPLVALEQIGAGIHYDVWCCWRAIMQSRAALTDGGSNG